MAMNLLYSELLDVLEEYHSLGIAEQIDYDKFYLYSLITHSTAIEGSTVTEIENQLLFDEGISVKGRSIREQMMNLDLKKAYEYSLELAKQHRDFSVDMLRELSSIVMKNTGGIYNTALGTFDASHGDLRLVNVSAGIGGKSYLDFHKVPAYLDEYCDDMNRLRKAIMHENNIVKQYLLSFDAHFRLVTIHPWVDGNGRMSRLIMNHIQFECGLVPTKVNKEDKAEYISALIASREMDSTEPFQRFMFTEHIRNLLSEIEEYKKTQGGQKNAKVERKGGQKTRDAILELVASDEKITTTEMAERIGINRSAISKHLQRLKAEGLLRRIGPDKGGRWEILR